MFLRYAPQLPVLGFQLGVEHSKDVTEFAIMDVLLELDGILASKEEQQTTRKTIRCLLMPLARTESLKLLLTGI